MIEVLLHSIKVKYTYKINTMLYSFKRVPGIKEVIKDDIYDTLSSGAFLILALFYSIYRLLIRSALIKILFIGFIGISAYSIADESGVDILLLFLGFFLMMSTIVADIYRIVLDLDYDAEYMIQMFKVDPKKYILSNYFTKLLEVIFVFIPSFFILCILIKIPIYYTLLCTSFYIGLRLFILSVDMRFFTSTIKRKIVYYGLFFLSAIPITLIVFKYYDIVLISNIYLIFMSVVGLLSLIYIFRFKKYKQFFKYIYDAKREIKSKAKTNYVDSSITKGLKYTDIKNNNKEGFDLIHDIFVQRHKKILIEPIVFFSIISIVAIVALLYFIIYTDLPLSEFIFNRLASIMLILYFVNRGQVLTKAMFVNCDHSLLNYRLYRTPEVILEMFKRRLKTLIKYNIVPALILSIGLAVCLLCEGGVNKIDIAIVSVSILCMSIFFSIHNLVLYYLLQPYTENTDVKNKTYTAITLATYIACYFFDMFEPGIYTFGVSMIVFTIIYSIVSLILVNKYAPKTFKMHL